ncbi:hypothetical protein BJ912DRAFT_1048029 [Pholiota molesta]|nr:hypothetical protein BJ912DRAFT_1048029 [Pholiota molesta]
MAPHFLIPLFSALLFSRSIRRARRRCPPACPLVDGDALRLAYNQHSRAEPGCARGSRSILAYRATTTVIYEMRPVVVADYARYAGAVPLRNRVSKPRCCLKSDASYRLLDWTFRSSPSPSSSLGVDVRFPPGYGAVRRLGRGSLPGPSATSSACRRRRRALISNRIDAGRKRRYRREGCNARSSGVAALVLPLPRRESSIRYPSGVVSLRP